MNWIVPAKGEIVSPFGMRNGKMHEGVDLGTPNGSNVLASEAGKVTYAGISGGYGNLMKVKHAGGHETRYAHLSKFIVPSGTNVTQGQLIALSGGVKGTAGAGNSTGAHLHTEHRVNGKAVDPVPYWKGGTVTEAEADAAEAARAANPLNSIGQIGTFLTTGANWVRIGTFILGALLIWIAVYAIILKSAPAQAVKDIAVGAVKTATPAGKAGSVVKAATAVTGVTK